MPENSNGNENEFDEKKEIEKLQATIRSISNFTSDEEGFISQSPKALMGGSPLGQIEEQSATDIDPYEALERPIIRNKDKKAKKYVIMIKAENIDFFDKIPMENRTELFNKLLSDYQKHLAEQQKKEKTIKITKHMAVAALTIMLTLPIMFLVVKTSIQLTIKNYKDVQYSFEKLYESKNQNRFNNVHRTIY